MGEEALCKWYKEEQGKNAQKGTVGFESQQK